MTDNIVSFGQTYYETNTDQVGSLFSDDQAVQHAESPKVVDTVLPHISYIKQATMLTIRYRAQAKNDMIARGDQ